MIGNNIKNIRKRKGLSITELAERADISKSYLSNIERNINDNPSIQVLMKIADVLDVDIRILLNIHTSNGTIDKEWADFIAELRALGMEKEKLEEFKLIIEFIKWKKKDNEAPPTSKNE